jgi:hypothetical protein
LDGFIIINAVLSRTIKKTSKTGFLESFSKADQAFDKALTFVEEKVAIPRLERVIVSLYSKGET